MKRNKIDRKDKPQRNALNVLFDTLNINCSRIVNKSYSLRII